MLEGSIGVLVHVLHIAWSTTYESVPLDDTRSYNRELTLLGVWGINPAAELLGRLTHTMGDGLEAAHRLCRQRAKAAHRPLSR